jgi:two-component system, NarL family, sensor histidine kinase DesK
MRDEDEMSGTEGSAGRDMAWPPAGPSPGVARKYTGPGSGGPLRWFFSGVWLVYLIAPVASLFGHHHGPLFIAAAVVITAAFCVVYIAVIGTWDLHPRLARQELAVLVVLAVAACVIYGSQWLPLWIYVSAAVGFIVPARRTAALAVLGVSGCYALLALLAHDDMTDFLVILLPLILIGWAMNGFRMQIMLTRELIQARETVAKLAANEERLRLARDMHDLTGQSLSLVTLKSEVARKMLGRLPPTSERDAALTEVTDIGRVSRQTLHDIRDAVSGYLRPTLAIEVITARAALETAGICLDDDPGLTLRSGTFDADAEAALAWCLREAVTNVIRHSGATSCRARLTQPAGQVSVELSDNGRGFGGPPDGTGRVNAAGTGLRGMSERLAAVGGSLSLGSAGADDRGFRLVATVPQAPAGTVPQAPASTMPQAPASPLPQAPASTVPQAPANTGPQATPVAGQARPE